MTIKNRESKRTAKVGGITLGYSPMPHLPHNTHPPTKKTSWALPWTLVLISMITAQSALKWGSENVGLSSSSEHSDES